MKDLNLTPRGTEKAVRIYRYLNRNNPEPIPCTFDGQELPTDLKYFCCMSSDELFEEYIAILYDNGADFYRRRRLLGKDWAILDWLFGPLEHRLHRYNWLNGKETTSEYRKQYAAYLNKGYRLRTPQGHVRSRRESYYNAIRLESLLSEEEWRDIQILRQGPDHEPPPAYEVIEYEEQVTEEDIEAIPPHVLKYLLRVDRGHFERHLE